MKILTYCLLLILCFSNILSGMQARGHKRLKIDDAAARKAQAQLDALPAHHYLRLKRLYDEQLTDALKLAMSRDETWATPAQILQKIVALEKPDGQEYVLVLHMLADRIFATYSHRRPYALIASLADLESDPAKRALIKQVLAEEHDADISSDARAALQVKIDEFNKKMAHKWKWETLRWHCQWDADYDQETFINRNLC